MTCKRGGSNITWRRWGFQNYLEEESSNITGRREDPKLPGEGVFQNYLEEGGSKITWRRGGSKITWRRGVTKLPGGGGSQNYLKGNFVTAW